MDFYERLFFMACVEEKSENETKLLLKKYFLCISINSGDETR